MDTTTPTMQHAWTDALPTLVNVLANTAPGEQARSDALYQLFRMAHAADVQAFVAESQDRGGPPIEPQVEPLRAWVANR